MSFPPEPKPSAVVVLRRPNGEIYLVERPETASFFPGFLAFPGGGVDPEDEQDSELATLTACAVREVAEEVDVELDPDDLDPAGVVVTPPFSPIRYRTQFFLVEVDQDLDPDPQQPELAGGRWTWPKDVLDDWRDGAAKLPPPVIHTLELLAQQGPGAVRARGTTVDEFPITFLPGLRVEPLEVRTLPPHTHVNSFLVGDDRMAVVDPGAGKPELDTLLGTLEHLEVTGDELAYVLLTHHHEDHVDGVQALVDAFDPIVAASATTAERVDVEVDRVLADGDVLELDDHTVEAIATPGHAPGHLAFHLPRAQTILTGDLIAGIGTVLIEPSDGDMADYLESLDRLATFCKDQDVRLAFPAHGPPIFDPAAKIRDTLEHRRMREERVLDALSKEPEALEAIAERAYQDKPDAPEPLKRMSTEAHLVKLVDEGRAVQVDGAWRRA